MEGISASLPLPPPSHIGVIVNGIDAAVEFFSSTWQVDFSVVEDVLPPQDDKILGESYRIKLATAKLGPLEIHLIEPLDNKSIYGQWLENNKEGGLHHLAFSVPNWSEMVSNMKEHGATMLGAFIYRGDLEPGAKDKGVRCGYFNTPGGTIVEFVETFEE
jgi:hypothetical protein